MNRVWTIPNLLSVARILATPLICYWIWIDDLKPAFYLTALTGSLDFFDGYIARKFNQESNLGRMLDPIGDKIILVGLLSAFYLKGWIPGFFILTLLIKDVNLLVMSYAIKSVYPQWLPSVLKESKYLTAIIGIFLLCVFSSHTFDIAFNIDSVVWISSSIISIYILYCWSLYVSLAIEYMKNQKDTND